MSPRAPRVGRVAPAVLVVAALVAGAVAPSARATPGGGLAVAPPTWTDCAAVIDNTAALPTAQCTTVAVPVDYANPAGAQAQLAVIRIPASGTRIGTLLINPGGPGASAVDSVATTAPRLAGTDLGRSFDLVGFDPRGVGHSTPAIRCRSDEEFDAYRREPLVDFSPAGVAHIEQVYRSVADGCLARTGPEFLSSVGTASTVRDMDVVREALGENQLNYLGYSYGTLLGARYAQAHPDQVRAMVLDAAINPAEDPISAAISQLAGFQRVFDAYAASCRRYRDCPLGSDPAQAVARYRTLVDPLVRAPAPTSDPRGLSYADAITGTLKALYTPRYWDFLTSGLLGLARGTDPGDLLLLADEYQLRDPAGHYANLQDAFTAIRCVDSAFPTDPAPWVAADREIRQVAPFASYGTFTGFAPRDICALWPVPATSGPAPVSSPGPGKAVVVSTTRDPATPYADGVELARQLQAPLVTYDGEQHTVVFSGNDCIDQPVERYLVELTPPAPGLRC
ncbi:alpha/beta hydrolase [Mycobacterium sp. MYCO198283]|uniref:alpha/beta hydrolase n=1 Tax=Mycobacterium sp. MYCO198283 TaxID=2883505 RepID=UPI001E5581CF|nr:alpha/beta hydrolase [Mycobacterium sp. MYCO198283]